MPALLIGIADGAGSAIASDVGSAQAIEFLFRKVSSLRTPRDLSESVAKEWMLETRAHLASTADAIGLATKDLACTVLLAVVSEHSSAFIQVGDGAWVFEDASNHLQCATWPSGGEYANQTTFITSPAWEDAFQYCRFENHVLAVAGFSDGLQGLALQFASRTAHAPFFDPMFKPLRAAEDETALKAPLIEFLASHSVTERTDDDKSLVLACWDTVKLAMRCGLTKMDG